LIRKRFQLSFAQHVNRTDWVQLTVESTAAIIDGALLIIAPGTASQLLAVTLGLFGLIYGLSLLLSLISDRTEWGFRAGGGIASMVVGGLLLALPAQLGYITCVILVWLAATLGIMSGLIRIVLGFGNYDTRRGVLGIVILFASIGLLVLVIVRQPLGPRLIGALLTFGGVAGLVAAQGKRRAPAQVTEVTKPAPHKAVAGRR
jgi:uncharacterized membrane protein HdeD (DUF308 family)